MSDPTTPTTPTPSLTLSAILLGKARTADSAVHEVTLKIQSDILTLRLSPEDAAIFPDLSTTVGGAHPLYDPYRIEYASAPGYRVTITPILPEPATAEAGESPITISGPEATPAIAAAASTPEE